ncbi:L,D-transpeptidase family protein [Sulfurovum sp. CS9]|uniref:L,D-transpeptidase family protein n=1 Tax=Sulfurovum sp. CS9 TaxID=3391146 RepID=UPI0039E98D80
MNIKIIVLAILVNLASLPAKVIEYQEIYQKDNSVFKEAMHMQIKSEVKKHTKEIQDLYAHIGYQPIWIDKDQITHDAGVLLDEIKLDKNRGLFSSLDKTYETLLKEEQLFDPAQTLKEKVALEFRFTQLYTKYIDAIIEGKKCDYTAATLIAYSLEKGSLVDGLNAIVKERVTYATPELRSKDRILKESKGLDEGIKTKCQTTYKTLDEMYKLLGHQPVWVGQSGISTYTTELFREIKEDITLDKNGKVYKEYQTLFAFEMPKENKKIVEYELKIAKLYKRYMEHLLYGEINWKKFQRDLKHNHRNAAWVTHDVVASPESLLVAAINEGSLVDAFEKAKPQLLWYEALLTALKKYQKITANGGWESLPVFETIKPEESNNSMLPLIRERLSIEGDYINCPETTDATDYDACLLDAVKTFQKRHGLAADGYIGKLTQKALSQSAEEKVAQIKLNINRMKWLKRDSERYRIFVNIPAFRMYVFDKQKQIQSMKVIVGKKRHETPVFYNRVRSIVLNPYWRIPRSIIRNELVPKLKKNRHYLIKNHIELHTGYSEHSPRVNSLKVNWHKYGRKLPPYKFMQSPGVTNALGKVKYLFPNKFAVYMHDTNAKSLFKKDIRAFSHGCVRLDKPFKLLETFSTIDAKVDFQKAEKILEHNRKTPIRLAKSIPIDMVYLTTWVNTEGTIEFRDDIYGYDKLHLSTYKTKSVSTSTD